MKKTFLILLLFVFSFSFCLLAIACEDTDETNTNDESVVDSISLEGEGNVVEWSAEGSSAKGFKVVWSKNENPTYPCRGGDKYHYYSNPEKVKDKLTAFSGNGTYYVRVCEYLGGKCGIYSNQVTITLGDATEKNDEAQKVVTSILLAGEGSKVKWKVEGYSKSGYKVVWSLNDGPTYPIREGDRYHYRSNPNANSDFITPFSGNGTYYVRVCEYLGGKCGVYSNQITVELTNAKEKGVVEIKEIRDTAKNLYNNKIDILLKEIKQLRDMVREQQVKLNHLIRLKSGLAQTITSAVENAINNFITYGVDENTQKLGEGERAAVMYSFKSAFGKLPETEDELEDAIKIANGRWPGIINSAAEARAKEQFAKIYLREADMNDAHDAAAIKVMAYGLRQRAKNRNLNSERAGLKIFRSIFKKLPQTTEEWNALQAITYSGAQR